MGSLFYGRWNQVWILGLLNQSCFDWAGDHVCLIGLDSKLNYRFINAITIGPTRIINEQHGLFPDYDSFRPTTSSRFKTEKHSELKYLIVVRGLHTNEQILSEADNSLLSTICIQNETVYSLPRYDQWTEYLLEHENRVCPWVGQTSDRCRL